jgi:thiol:disulfide interchange protein DsbC
MAILKKFMLYLTTMKTYKLTAIAIFAICFLALPYYSSAQQSSAPTTDHDCMKCHKITVDDVVKILKNDLPADAKILEVNEAPVKGFVEVIFKIGNQQQKNLFYLDAGKNFLIARDILDLKTKKNLPAERLLALNMITVDTKKIPLANALIVGNKKAKNKVIVFTDPDCPFCGKLHEELKKVVEKRKDIAFYLKLYPLTQLHPQAYDKSKTILCKKSLALLEDVYKGKEIPAPDCDSKEVDENIKLATELGIKGTPAMVLPNGNVRPGYIDADSIINIVDDKKVESKKK